MEWPRLKNIIILILLLANLFLLALVGVQEHGTAKYQEQALANTISVLDRNGIQVDLGGIPEKLELEVLTVERELEQETLLAEALLGECEMSDLGAGRYTYESDLGRAEFRSNGSFSVTLTAGAHLAGQDGEVSHALSLLEDAKLTAVGAEQTREGDKTSVTLFQSWENVPVYSCRLTLQYEEGALLSISGQRLMGTPRESAEKVELLDVPTALLRILNGINDLGDVCEMIRSMEPGYLLTTTPDAASLIPVWQVTTDTGVYRLNAATGALERG